MPGQINYRAMSNIYIYVLDPSDEDVTDMVEYCEDNALSLVTHSCVDTSDTHSNYDTIAEFIFCDEESAVIFKLRFQ